MVEKGRSEILEAPLYGVSTRMFVIIESSCENTDWHALRGRSLALLIMIPERNQRV